MHCSSLSFANNSLRHYENILISRRHCRFICHSTCVCHGGHTNCMHVRSYCHSYGRGDGNCYVWRVRSACAHGLTFFRVNNNSEGKACKATLSFPNSDFLPLYFDFLGVGCIGLEILEFTIPIGAPNGDAYISWFANLHE